MSRPFGGTQIHNVNAKKEHVHPKQANIYSGDLLVFNHKLSKPSNPPIAGSPPSAQSSFQIRFTCSQSEVR